MVLTRLLTSAALAALLAAGPTAAWADPLSADQSVRVGTFAGFTAIRDWEVVQAGDMTTVTAPEGDMRFYVFDIGAAKDGPAAIAAAAVRVPALAGLKIEETIHPAPTDGWDERVTSYYDVPPAQHRITLAGALRQADHWLVLVADGSQATFDKRVWASTGTLPRGSRTPRPPSQTTLPFSSKAMPTPGTLSCVIPLRTKSLSASIRAGVSGLAGLPVKSSLA